MGVQALVIFLTYMLIAIPNFSYVDCGFFACGKFELTASNVD